MSVPITPERWQTVRRLFRDGFISSFHFSVATVTPSGAPRITPIGSLVLGEPGRGFYFEEYATGLRCDLELNPHLCAMAVNTSRWLLLGALLRGRASEPFGVRLHGTAGPRRPATPEESASFSRRVRLLRFFRGHQLLWGKLRTVREVHFDTMDPVRLPPLGDPWNERNVAGLA